MERMTDEQINRAIAEACGWKLLANNRWTKPCGIYADLPNYTADLNAMHKAEKVLSKLEQDQYWDHLKDMTCEGFDQLHSNSLQRAEAFLRTINLWKQ